MPVRRQTQSYLRSLFAQRGITPQHRLGQNFLIDLNLHEVIVKAAELGPRDVVLEVGSGAGAMTTLLARQAAAVVAVEVDATMALLTSEATAGQPNVRILNLDALAGKHALEPELIDQVRAGLDIAAERQFKLVSNLPFSVATPIVSNLLVHPDLRPVLMVVTIQLELAERMTAQPETSAYGSLSVLVQSLAEVEIVRRLPPSVFWPRPRVDSAIVRITPKPEKRAAVLDLAWFHSVVRQIFLHRRKNLRGVLHNLWREHWSKAEVDELLGTLGQTGLVRAEAMNVEEFIDLAHALKKRLGQPISTLRADDAIDRSE